MASLPPTSELADASERFDKKALLQFHDLTRHRLENIPADIFPVYIFSDFIAISCTFKATRTLLPLECLEPISLTQLQVWKVHLGRVLYSTLCAEAFKTSGIVMTMLEDDNGLAVRLAIYNVHHSQTNIESLYPMGVKLAIRDPYFKRAGDGSLAIRIENPANIQMHVTHKE